MSIADDVVWMCADAPGAVDVVNSHGQRSRGPRRQMDREQPDGAGYTRLVPVTVLSIPTAHLDRTSIDETVDVTDEDGVRTTYVVRDRQLAEDGRLTRLVVVVA